MNFKEWFFLEDNEEENNFNKIIVEFAIQKDLPMPTSHLDSGEEAYVFYTSNPDIVARITKDKDLTGCEKIIETPSIQETGGVVKIIISGMHNNYFISYKEKVDVNWKRKIDPKHKKKILFILENLLMDYFARDYKKIEERIQELSKFKQTENMAKAFNLNSNLIKDIHDENLGINKFGNLVIIDC